MFKLNYLCGINSHLAAARGYDAADLLSQAKRMAAEMDMRPPPGRAVAGERLTLAVQARLQPQAQAQARTHNAQAPSEDDDAGERLRRAVQARLPKRPQHKHARAASSNDEETLGQRLARITKARAKGIRVCRA